MPSFTFPRCTLFPDVILNERRYATPREGSPNPLPLSPTRTPNGLLRYRVLAGILPRVARKGAMAVLSMLHGLETHATC